MSETGTKTRANTLYEKDFFAWTQEQAQLLRERRWNDLDLDNLVDEVESVGSSEKREIRSRLKVLIANLLKWKYQPGGRGNSWRNTINQQRERLAMVIEDSPSLNGYVREKAIGMYLSGLLKAASETGIIINLFPQESPFTADQVLDPEFYPEDPANE